MTNLKFYKGEEPTNVENGSLWFNSQNKTINIRTSDLWETYGNIDTSIPAEPTDVSSPSTKLFKTELDKKQNDLGLSLSDKNIIRTNVTSVSQVTSGTSNFVWAAGSTISGSGNLVFGAQNTILVQSQANAVFGAKNTVNGNSCLVQGQRSNITGSFNAACGYKNTINGLNNTVFGQRHNVSGNLSFCAGLNNSVQADNAVALGYDTSALAEESTALGGSWVGQLTVTGDANSTVYNYTADDEAFNTLVVGNMLFSNAFGSQESYIIKAIDVENQTITLDRTLNSEQAVTNTKVYANATIALGKYSIAHRGISKGYSSIAMGRGNYAVGNVSQAFGNYSITNNDYEFATGIYNKSNTGTVFSIGNGTSETDRKNLIEIMQDGSVYYQNIGNYNGTNPTEAKTVQTVIAELKQKVDTGLTWESWN